MFFRKKDPARNRVNFTEAVSGGLQLAPNEPVYQVLADDYDRMLSDGMLLDDKELFDNLITKCTGIQRREAHSGCHRTGPRRNAAGYPIWHWLEYTLTGKSGPILTIGRTVFEMWLGAI